MSILTDTVSQFQNLEVQFVAMNNKMYNRFTFLEAMFGVDLVERDYSSLTELKAHLKQIATDEDKDQTCLSDAIELLVGVETLLKNYNGEISTLPKGYSDIDDIDDLIKLTHLTKTTNVKTINSNYFEDAKYSKDKGVYRHTLTERQASRIKPQESIGIPVGGINSELFVLNGEDVIKVGIKDKFRKVWKKQFFSFNTGQEAVLIAESEKLKDDSDAKTFIQVIETLVEKKLDIRNQLFINAKKEDTTLEEGILKINYKIGNSKYSVIKHVEVIPNVLYRASRAHVVPLSGTKEDAWIILN